MATAGLYRRVLPSPPAIDFASPQGKKIFAEAIADGTMEGFFKLISYYQTQSEPAYCGLATIAMVLNALSIDPGRKWKGPWRWFDDSMLDCCEPLAKIKEQGITFGKVACLAQCNGAKVEAFRTNKTTIKDFRKNIIHCTSSEDYHLVVSYHRGIFKQTGSGHFSPIGGYNTQRDLVLILDVARFKYPPHWVPLPLLWEAMSTIDDETKLHRGYMIMSRLSGPPSILYTVSCRHEGWNFVVRYLTEEVPHLLKSKDVKDVQDVLSVIFRSPPVDVRGLVTWVAEVRRQEDGKLTLSEEEKGRLAIKEDIMKQVRETELFKHTAKWLDSEKCACCNKARLGDTEQLSELATSVCCQGAVTLSGAVVSSTETCCKLVNVKHVEANGEKTVTVVSGTVTNDGSRQDIDVLVPCCQSACSSLCSSSQGHCIGIHPSTADVLTVLLLALPPHTWSGLEEEKLQVEIKSLASSDNLPSLLREEVLFLRRQLDFLMTDLSSVAT